MNFTGRQPGNFVYVLCKTVCFKIAFEENTVGMSHLKI